MSFELKLKDSFIFVSSSSDNCPSGREFKVVLTFSEYALTKLAPSKFLESKSLRMVF